MAAPIVINDLTALTGANTDADADSLAIWDNSVNTTKKISPRELHAGSLWPTTLAVTSDISLTGTFSVTGLLTASAGLTVSTGNLTVSTGNLQLPTNVFITFGGQNTLLAIAGGSTFLQSGSGQAVIVRDGGPTTAATFSGGNTTLAGHLLRTGATQDIGASGSGWRTGYFGTSVVTALLDSTGATKAFSGTAIPAGGTAGSGFLFSSTANYGIFFGSGVPTLSAAQGSLYLRSDGSTTSTRAYINTDGGTTWTAITTAA